MSEIVLRLNTGLMWRLLRLAFGLSLRKLKKLVNGAYWWRKMLL